MERELTVAFTAWTNSQGTLSVIIGAMGLAWAVYAKFRDWDEEKRKQLRESFAERHRRAQEPSLNTRVDVLEKKLGDANDELKKLRIEIEDMRRE
jgi:type VI protein secretion system component VasK